MITPGKPLLADQAVVPCEPGVTDKEVVQVQPPLLAGQSLSAWNWSGLTVSLGSAEQLHGTWTILAGPVKTRSAVGGQSVFVRMALTSTVWPGNRVPLDGLKYTPEALVEAVQLRPDGLFASLLN